MLYPQTIEELEHVLIMDFRFDRGHDYFIRDGKIAWLGIWRSVLPHLVNRIGPGWKVIEHRANPQGSDAFLRIDIVPSDNA